MLGSFLDFVKEMDIEFCTDVDMSSASYIKAGGRAAVTVTPKDIPEFVSVLDRLRNTELPFKVVGRMTNSMVSSNGFDGIIIKTHKLDRKNKADNLLVTECGARLSHVLWYGIKNGLGGGEELFMIPGSMGGALYNNAGAHGRTISDLVCAAEVYRMDSGKTDTLTADELQFGYRDSIFRSGRVMLLSCVLALDEIPISLPKERISGFVSARRSSQPLEYPSLGSVFKRYDGTGAGYFIEKAGLKGYRIGGAEVSRKHAGFIINVSDATALDVEMLIRSVKDQVSDKLSVRLEEEIEIIG